MAGCSEQEGLRRRSPSKRKRRSVRGYPPDHGNRLRRSKGPKQGCTKEIREEEAFNEAEASSKKEASRQEKEEVNTLSMAPRIRFLGAIVYF
jgi:hypothetical protein